MTSASDVQAESKRSNGQAVAAIAAAVVIGALVAWAGSTGAKSAGGIGIHWWVAAVAFGVNWIAFVPSFLKRTEHYYDLVGSLTYLSTTLLAALLASPLDARAWLLLLLVVIWSGRLGIFLFRRVRSTGKDGRFDTIKQSAPRFMVAWTTQGLWVIFTAAAAHAAIASADPQPFGILGVVGLALWLAGFGMEALADAQKSAFRADPANDGRFITTGLWAWSRHPNYFGEILLWVGVAVIALPALSGWQYMTLLSPVFVFLLLTRVSGIPMLERRADKRWGGEDEYEAYKARTPVLIPPAAELNASVSKGESMGEYALSERDGHLFVITINRPEVMNALHPMANAELSELVDEFADDAELWVAIITGAGDRAFSAGNDLKFQAGAGGERPQHPETGFAGLTNRWDLNKPVIAAVNGVAMGGGFEIALACDLIIASENARFALPEPKVGLAALAGGIHRLPRQIGMKRAMGMMLTGRHVSAQEGRELGFVNDVVPQEQLMDRAREWASMILACSPMSIRATKEAAYQGLDHASLREAYSGRYPAVKAMIDSDDFVEGPLAFAGKRAPQWKGR